MNIEINIFAHTPNGPDFDITFVVPAASTDGRTIERLEAIARAALIDYPPELTALAYFETGEQPDELDAPMSLEPNTIFHVELFGDAIDGLTLRATRTEAEPTVTDPSGQLVAELATFAVNFQRQPYEGAKLIAVLDRVEHERPEA